MSGTNPTMIVTGYHPPATSMAALRGTKGRDKLLIDAAVDRIAASQHSERIGDGHRRAQELANESLVTQ